ncbi:recombination regulator RecX [Clostridium sp.]|uniref:recombination regulator RecX n=1 Tax=Clostridium sp. TaxID=1506 RepID=UPI002FC61345
MKSIITKIESQKKSKERVNVFINEEFAFACSNELIYYHGLKKGLEINPKDLEDVIKDDNYIKGKSTALKYMEKSMKTQKQIEDMLLKREFQLDTINKVIEFLESYGFLDDRKYAENYVKQKIASSGINKIRQDLMRKGIDKELIKEILAKVDTEQEYDVAFNLAQKKLNNLVKKEKDKNKVFQKITYHLVSKGYNFSLINEVLPKLSLQFEEEEEKDNRETDFEELLNLAQKKYDLLKNRESDEFKLKRKLQDFLLRKGYSYEDIKTVILQVIK